MTIANLPLDAASMLEGSREEGGVLGNRALGDSLGSDRDIPGNVRLRVSRNFKERYGTKHGTIRHTCGPGQHRVLAHDSKG